MAASLKDLFRASVLLGTGFAVGAACAFLDAMQGPDEAVVPTCLASADDCNLDAADGCETDLNSDVNHCGVCENVCALDHAIASCEDGSCSFSACEAGYEDANSLREDGCEAMVS